MKKCGSINEEDEGMNELSIVAMFDDICRNSRTLSVGIEAEFIAYVEGIEELRKEWKSSEENEVKTKKLQTDIRTLETKLKHARKQIEVEMGKRKRVEEERDIYEKQLNLLRELLEEKSTTFNENERQRFAVIQNHSLSRQASSQKTLNSEAADDLHSTPSDLSYDKTEEDIFEVPLLVPHPSAPPCSDEDQFKYNMAGSGLAFKWNNTPHHNKIPQHINNTPQHSNNNIWSNGLKKKEGDKQLKRHRRSKSADLASSEVKVKRKSSPFSSPFNRHSSQDSMAPVGSEDMKRFNSGSSLTRPHFFISAKNYKGDECHVCHKKFKFAGSQQKCKDCKIWCHDGCTTQAPLPCMACINTPKCSKDKPRVIGDYAPTEPPFVPAIVILCINEVESRGLTEQGLYRVSGSGREVKELKERLQAGKNVPLGGVADIHVVCSFFKDFLRTLKESILTHKLWIHFKQASEQANNMDSDLIQAVSLLPLCNRDTLAFIMLHLQKVAEVREVQMDVNNLSMVFAPTLVGEPHPSSPEASLPVDVLINIQRKIMLKMLNLPSDYWYSFIKINDPSIQCSSNTPSIVSSPSANTTILSNNNNDFWSNKKVGWFNNANSNTNLGEIRVENYFKTPSKFFSTPK